MTERQIRLLHDLGFNYGEITIFGEILEKENISLVALLRQAMQKYQGTDNIEFPPSSVTD